MPNTIVHFKIVSKNSIYHVRAAEVDSVRSVNVTKVAGRKHKWPPLETNLQGTELRINAEDFYLVARAQTVLRAGIVGIFLDALAASECYAASNLQPYDPRWQKETHQALCGLVGVPGVLINLHSEDPTIPPPSS